MNFFGYRKQDKHLVGLRSILLLVFTTVSIFSPAAAQTYRLEGLPPPGAMVQLSSPFVPMLLKGLVIHPEEPFNLDFIVDSGDETFPSQEIQSLLDPLVKYFLASIAVPEKDLWVNLSPYEEERILPESLNQTQLGRDMLAQDYLLKQLSSSLMHPDGEAGMKFWDEVYQKAREKFGTTEIPVNTFNKIWILPAQAEIYENDNSVYVTSARLKVMLDEDYLALAKNKNGKDTDVGPVPEDPYDTSASLSSQVIREVILPLVEREVNEGKNFALLRQIYHSLILAQWYKEAIKDSLLGEALTQRDTIQGLMEVDATMKEALYARYVDAYKKGVFDFIREDYDQMNAEIQQRQYFSGGEILYSIPFQTPSGVPVITSVGDTSVAKLQLGSQPPQQRNIVAIPSDQEILGGSGTMGRWHYDLAVYNSSTGEITLYGATRIPNKDKRIGLKGVEKEFLIDGENKPRDIVLKTRELAPQEMSKIVLPMDELRIRTPLRVLVRDEAAISNRIYGIAVDGHIFVREDILNEGSHDQIKEAIDHEALELSGATHDEAREDLQFKGGLRDLIRKLSDRDKIEKESWQYLDEINRLIEPYANKLRDLLTMYNNFRALSIEGALQAETLGELKRIEEEILSIVHKINAFRTENFKDKLEMPVLQSIEEEIIPESEIASVERDQLYGHYVPTIFLGGSMTRMQDSIRALEVGEDPVNSLYFLDPGKIMQAYLKSGVDIDSKTESIIKDYLNYPRRHALKLGPRLLLIYRGYIEQLARKYGRDVGKALAKQKLVLAISERNEVEILQDLIANDFYGFNKKNIFFVSQNANHGYGFLDGGLKIIPESEELPLGPAVPIMMTGTPHTAFRVVPDGDGSYTKEYVSEALKSELKKAGHKYLPTYRINDLTKFRLEKIANPRQIAYAKMWFGEEGYHAIAEFVTNYQNDPQKGAYFFSTKKNPAIILENLKIMGNPRAQKLIKNEARKGRANYSAFRLIYNLKNLSDVLDKYKKSWNLRFRNGYLYLEAYTGDMTLDPSILVRGYSVPQIIHDFKQVRPDQLADASMYLKGSEDDLQDIFRSNEDHMPVLERAAGFRVIKYLPGSGKGRVMLIERDGKQLVRKEEKRSKPGGRVKLVDEIEFLLSLPKTTYNATNFPEVLDHRFKEQDEVVWYEMPYYPEEEWMPLEQLIIQGKVTPEETMAIIDRILTDLTDGEFYQKVERNVNKDEYVKSQFKKKPKRRIKEAKAKSRVFSKLSKYSCVINGVKGFPYRNILNGLVFSEGEKLAPDDLFRIHGDLFPENILVNLKDLRSKKGPVKTILLDPKGSKAGLDIYYELTKLGESILGLYGYALREDDAFEIRHQLDHEKEEFNINYMIKPTPARRGYSKITELFLKYLEDPDNPVMKLTGKKIDWTRFYVLLANTIFSTIPFNTKENEYPKQPLLMYVMATRILQQVAENRDNPMITLDTSLGNNIQDDTRVVRSLREMTEEGKHILVGFDIDGTLRDHDEDEVRDDIIFPIIALNNELKGKGNIYIDTGNDVNRLRRFFLDPYHRVVSQNVEGSPDDFIYITVQDSAATYKFYPMINKLEVLYAAPPIGDENQLAIMGKINQMMKEFGVTRGDGQIVVQGNGTRIKFTEPGIQATILERESFHEKDQREGLRKKYQEFLVPKLDKYGVYPYIKGRTSIDIMSPEMNKRNGLGQLGKYVKGLEDKEVAMVFFEDQNANELAEVVDLLVYVGSEKFEGKPHENVLWGTKEQNIPGSRAANQYIYEALSFFLEQNQTSQDPFGGIDMNEIHFQRQGFGHRIKFNESAIRSVLDPSHPSLFPVMIKVTPVKNILQLLGFDPVEPRRQNKAA